MVRSFRPVPGDPEAVVGAFMDDPGRWLPDGRHTGSNTWTMTLRAGPWTRKVEARLGSPWRSGTSYWRSLSWEPMPTESTEHWPTGRLLPSLDGELGVHRFGDHATLVLDGRYRPPGGAVGAAIDRVALHRVAQRTVERLLNDVGDLVSADSLLVATPDDPG